jgi:hypothetical protein
MMGLEQATLPVTPATGGCSSTAESALVGHGSDGDTVELPQKIDVPVIAAQLAVRDGAQPDRLLLLDNVANAIVFDTPQPVHGQRALLELRAGARENRRTQQAADLVGAERWLHRVGGRFGTRTSGGQCRYCARPSGKARSTESATAVPRTAIW